MDLAQTLRWTYQPPPKPQTTKSSSKKSSAAAATEPPTPAVTSPELRDRLQQAALGALAMLVVDKGVRSRLMRIEPCSQLLFGLAQDLPGYEGPWARRRRLMAAQTLTNVLIRDAEARYQLVGPSPQPQPLTITLLMCAAFEFMSLACLRGVSREQLR